jgi:hypothetical protein
MAKWGCLVHRKKNWQSYDKKLAQYRTAFCLTQKKYAYRSSVVDVDAGLNFRTS